ncbi:MAG TPA: serine/threonine-protein kinase, partial [Nannocystis sp.]
MVERLHEGPATIVYRGRRDADGSTVALKILRGDPPSPADVEQLRREHALLAGLAVPGLPRVFGLETLDGRLCLVMEALPGRPLDEVLATGRLPLATVLRLGVVLAGVIGRLHLAGVIHKDIKPANIVVDLDAGEAMLVDLGVAALRSEAPLREGEIEGTLAYLSPEQTGRMNRRVDHRADLYSFGVTLYEMVTGALPFTSTDPLEIVHSHVARAPTPPHARDAPQVVSDIIVKLLAKAAEDRYQSAFGLQADLESCLESLHRTGRVEPFVLG